MISNFFEFVDTLFYNFCLFHGEDKQKHLRT